MKKRKPTLTPKHSAKDYPFILQYDAGDKVYIARAVDLNGCHSDGRTPQEAARNILKAIAGWLETANKKKLSIPKPTALAGESKKFLLRIEPQNVVKLEMIASARNESLNQLINQAIAAL